MSGHRSPAGTYERILKSLLEDPELPDREFRLALYAAAKPPGFVFRPEVIAAELQRPANWVKQAMAGLRKRGLMLVEEERKPGGAFVRRTTTLARDKVVAGRPLTSVDASFRRSQPAVRIPSAGADLGERGVSAGRSHKQGFPAAGESPAIERTESTRENGVRERAAIAAPVAGVSDELTVAVGGGSETDTQPTTYGRHDDCGTELAWHARLGAKYCYRCKRMVAPAEVRPGSEIPACERHKRYGPRKGCRDCELVAADPLQPVGKASGF